MEKKKSPFCTLRFWRRAAVLFLVAYALLATVPYLPHKEVSEDFQAEYAARNFYGEGPGAERVAYIDNSEDALLCRLNLIQSAEKELILSTFDFNADEAGTDVLAALYQAAERGVQVRVLIDGTSGLLDVRGNENFRALEHHENAQIRIYNPIDLLRPWTMQARLHDKYLIADGARYLLGGRNTTDLFLGNYAPEKLNIDRELLVVGGDTAPDTSLRQLEQYFEAVWALPASRPLPDRAPRDEDALRDTLAQRYAALQAQWPQAFTDWDWEACTFETGAVNLLSNPIGPENKEPWMWYALSDLMSGAEDVVIYTPYIICGPEMYADLERITGGGAGVEILTNAVASGANPWGCTDYLNQKKRIRRTGVQVYEYMGTQSSHTKTLVLDDRLSVVGSYNLDMRSTYQDTELMLVVDSPELNRRIREEAERDKTYSRTMEADGTYVQGEHYNDQELGPVKQALYAVLRVAILPLRRFL